MDCLLLYFHNLYNPAIVNAQQGQTHCLKKLIKCVEIDCYLKPMKIMKIILNNGLQVTTIATTTGPLSDVYFPSVIVCSINQIRKSLFRVSSCHPFSKYRYSIIAHTKTKVNKNYDLRASKWREQGTSSCSWKLSTPVESSLWIKRWISFRSPCRIISSSSSGIPVFICVELCFLLRRKI